MKDACERAKSLPITIEIALLERTMMGARTARLPGRTCRATYAPAGRARHVAKLVPTIDGGGVVITWCHDAGRQSEVQIRAVYDVREVLAGTEAEVVVITNEYQLLAPPVYEAIAAVLRGQEPVPSTHHYDAIGAELAETARVLLGALGIPGFAAE